MSVQENKKQDDWFPKRIILSAGAWFRDSSTARRRIAAWQRVNNKKSTDLPGTHAELRDALGIKSDKVWLQFIVAFVNARSVLREGGPYNWAAASVNERLDDANALQQRDAIPNGEQAMKAAFKIPNGEQAMKAAFKFDVPMASPGGAVSPEQLAEARAHLAEVEKMVEQLKIDEQKKLDEAAKEIQKLQEAVANAKANRPTHLIVEDKKSGAKIDLGIQHFMVPALIKRLAAGVNVYLVGPAGSGKTTGAENAAAAIGLQFGFMSVGPQTTKTDILGYMSATGDYVETEFRRRDEHGGVFLFDEIDAGNGGVLTCINAALAGSAAAFPDKMVKRHEKFLCVAAGNTYGTGPDRVYVGRQELDGASIDRFDFLEWPYDEALELAIVSGIDKDTATYWVPFVQKVRKAVGKLNLRYVVSPRASINGAKLLLQGVARSEVETSAVFKAMKPDDIKRVMANL